MLYPNFAIFKVNDAGDRHVLAAAIKSNAEVIVTFNLRDFPAKNIAQYGIEAQHPDQFILHLIDLNPQLVCQAVTNQLKTLKNPLGNDALFQGHQRV